MNTALVASISGQSHEGRGIAQIDGKVVFIDGALPGERVTFRYARRRGRFDEGVLERVLLPAPERVAPRCPHTDRCGGCSLQHMSSAAQARHKQDVLLEQLARVGGVEPRSVLPVLSGPAFNYRHKARLSVRYVAKKARVLVGFRERRSAYVAELSRCDVLVPAVGRHLDIISEALTRLDCRDQIPQIEVAAGDEETVLVVRHLVPLTAGDVHTLQSLEQRLGVTIYCQAGGDDSIRPLSTPTQLRYRLNPCADRILEFQFQPTDFTQINFALNRAMVEQVLQLMAPDPADRVLDLFCGLGNFSLPMAMRAALVHGLEGDDGLVRRARDNARRNAVDNARFQVVDLMDDAQLQPVNALRFTKVLLDPPRSGAAALVQALDLERVKTLVYVSCNPATLARDAGVLVRRGLRLQQAGIVDMFPHTAHVESVAVFTPA